jgi:uncharacterized repeat protein (TIGR03803 family)
MARPIQTRFGWGQSRKLYCKFKLSDSEENTMHLAKFWPRTNSVVALLSLALFLATAFLTATRSAQAQTYTDLYNFTGGSDGGYPTTGSLTADGQGNFYGVATAGGKGYGVVFELSPNGSGGYNETAIYDFCSVEVNFVCTDGALAYYTPTLIFDNAGNLYGTTYDGGANNWGTVFELSPSGSGWTETVLYNFTDTEGFPTTGVIRDPAGNFYTTVVCPCATQQNGYYSGGVFELSQSGGVWTAQALFTDNLNGGPDTTGAGLVMDADGNIFGSTEWGGLAGSGGLFELSPNGEGGFGVSVIHSFAGAPKDGIEADGTMTIDKAGNLYGTTLAGGKKNVGTVFELVRKKKTGTFTEKILYSFPTNKDGLATEGSPYAGVVLDADGNIYGGTLNNVEGGDGVIYELVDGHKAKVLADLNQATGWEPYASLILYGGNLYGVAGGGGSHGNGAVFEVTP